MHALRGTGAVNHVASESDGSANPPSSPPPPAFFATVAVQSNIASNEPVLATLRIAYCLPYSRHVGVYESKGWSELLANTLLPHFARLH